VRYDGAAGRWPANVILDEDQADALDQQTGVLAAGGFPQTVNRKRGHGVLSDFTDETRPERIATDSGGASRYFFVAERDFDCCTEGESCSENGASGVATTSPATTNESDASQMAVPVDEMTTRFRYIAKADASERPSYVKAGGDTTILGGPIGKVCIKCGKQKVNVGTSACACAEPDFQPDPSKQGRVSHPTVKPLDLMRWLVRLVTPPGGTVLEPFAGSGTTVEACILEGFKCIAIEREADYLPLIVGRIQRRLDPVAAVRATVEDLGLFGLLDEDEGPAA
jgi:hypothetical protein